MIRECELIEDERFATAVECVNADDPPLTPAQRFVARWESRLHWLFIDLEFEF